MSTTDAATTHRTTASAHRTTATFPTGQWLADQAAHRERLADLWEDATPTEQLPVVGPRPTADRPRPTAFPRVSTLPEPTGGRGAEQPSSGCRARAERANRRRRHLHAALAGLALAAALLTGVQLYAAAGISSARQAALAQRDRAGAAPAVTSTTSTTPVTPVTPVSPVNTPQGNSSADDSANTAPAANVQPDWVTRDTGAPYVRTNPHASPLDLPPCTTSPDTPMPCLAWESADSRHAVVLEEDASLTALDRR